MARPRQITDENILEVARRCALEHGSGVTLEMVAHGLGVTAPALLKRFKSRDALLLAALRPNEEPPWLGELSLGPDRRPLHAQLEEMFARMLAFFEAEVPRMSALRESGIPLDAIFRRGRVPGPLRGIRALTGWLERGRTAGLVAAGELETAAAVMLGALQGRVYLPHMCKRPFWRNSDRRFIGELAALFTRTLAPDEKSAAASKVGRAGAAAAARKQRGIR